MTPPPPPPRPLTTIRAADIQDPAPETPPWLVEQLWGRGAVGVIGGAPKSCKSWLALELAVAVASGRPCLGRFAVAAAVPAPVLLYSAEDTAMQVRRRVEELCLARGTTLASLMLELIVEPSLRIDRAEDVARLRATLSLRKPTLLILDPYVRLQRADENNATEVAAILATLRALSREFGTALLLVHHARKSPGEHSGATLRGSSDFHAWGDSNLYLRRRAQELVLTVEHRAAAAPPPLTLALADSPLHLEIRDNPRLHDAQLSVHNSLEERLLALLADGPRRLEDLRSALGARKQYVSQALRTLATSGHVVRNADGWTRPRV